MMQFSLFAFFAFLTSTPTVNAFVEVNTTGLGACFSPYIFNLVINAASTASTVAEQAIGNATDFDPNRNFTTAGDFRIALETGNKVMTIITLFVILGVSLLMLFAGKLLVKMVTCLTSLLIAFMGFLYLWQWACQSMVHPMEGWVKCILPFVLACVCALIVAIVVVILSNKFEKFVFFVMGAAGGAAGMFFLQNFIVAGNPHLASEPLFNLFWLGLVAVAILCGLVAMCLKSQVTILVTSILGGYAFAIALCGLVPAFGGPYVPNYGFFITAGFAILFGILFQCFCCKDDPDKKARMEQYRADQDQRKKNAKKNPEGQGVQFIAP